MTIRRYTVTVSRTQSQTVTFLADDRDFTGQSMQHAVAFAYAADDQWAEESSRVSSLTSSPLENDDAP